MSRSHEERRKIEQRKFISKVKSLFNENALDYVRMGITSWKDLMKIYWVKCFKHSRTPGRSKHPMERTWEHNEQKKERFESKQQIKQEINNFDEVLDENYGEVGTEERKLFRKEAKEYIINNENNK